MSIYEGALGFAGVLLSSLTRITRGGIIHVYY